MNQSRKTRAGSPTRCAKSACRATVIATGREVEQAMNVFDGRREFTRTIGVAPHRGATPCPSRQETAIDSMTLWAMRPVSCTASVGVVAAELRISRNLYFGKEFRRAEVRREVYEAKPRSTPLDVGQHRLQALLGHRAGAERVLESLLRCDEALAFGTGRRAHAFVDRGDGVHLLGRERDLVLELEEVEGAGQAVEFRRLCEPQPLPCLNSLMPSGERLFISRVSSPA